jgi:hypothetical protein
MRGDAFAGAAWRKSSAYPRTALSNHSSRVFVGHARLSNPIETNAHAGDVPRISALMSGWLVVAPASAAAAGLAGRGDEAAGAGAGARPHPAATKTSAIATAAACHFPPCIAVFPTFDDAPGSRRAPEEA